MSFRKIIVFIIALMAILCVSAQAETAVALDDSGCTINSAGTYRISGTSAAGNIQVDTTGEVVLILDNVNIIANSGAPIDIKSAAKCTIILADNSENTLEAKAPGFAGLANNKNPLVISCEKSANTGHACGDTCGRLIAKGHNIEPFRNTAVCNTITGIVKTISDILKNTGKLDGALWTE